MVSWKLSAVAVVLASAVMANVVAKLERSFDFIAHQATATMYQAGPGVNSPEDQKLDRKIDILKDSFLLSWIIGGCIPGACVGIWIRTMVKMTEIAKTFGVSLFTSFAVSPYLIRVYLDPSPETCLLVGFLVSVGAWLGWEVILILAARIKIAATKYGWTGIKTEVLGGQMIVTPEQLPATIPVPLPASPEAKP